MEDIKISWYSDLYSTKPIGEISLLNSLERIRNGASSALIVQIRQLSKKAERDELKKQLPAITFAGTFSSRANKNLKLASGLACMDWDHLINPNEFRDNIFKEYDFILAAWISPSGDGVKALARIPIVKDDAEYKIYYKALQKEFDLEEPDNTTDISRLCYESFDPDIKIIDFDKVSIFDKQILNNKHDDPASSSSPDRVSDNLFNPILAKLGGQGKVYTLHSRNNFIHALACETNRAGIPEEKVIEYALNKFKEKDQLEMTKTVTSIKGVYERNRDEYGKEQSDDLAKMEAMDKTTRIEVDSPRPDEPSILSIEGYPVASIGGFSIISGLRKARKTHYVSFLTAVFLKGIIGNHIANLPINKNIVVYFDTEQSKGEAWDTLQKIANTAGRANAIKLRFYSLRPYTVQDRAIFINYVLSTNAGIGIVVIDGVRDLVIDINNPIEATQLFTTLFKWTGGFNIHIFGILHLNKTDGKIRGHIGSELENKAESIIKITIAPNEIPYSIVSFEAGRKLGFSHCAIGYDTNGLPMIVDIEDIKPSKPGKKAIKPQDMPLNDHQNKLSIIFKDSTGLGYKELQKEVSEVYGIGETKAVTFITYFITEKLTFKNNGKYYFKQIHQAKDINREDELPSEINNDAPF